MHACVVLMECNPYEGFGLGLWLWFWHPHSKLGIQ